MSVVLICDKGQINTSLDKFIDYLKTLLPTPVPKADGSSEITQIEEKINGAEFVNKGKQLLKKGEYAELVKHILTLDDLIFKDPKQAVSIFYIIGLICTKITPAEHQVKTVQELIGQVIDRQSVHFSLKFRILAALFNSFPEDSQARLIIWKSLVKLADETNRATVLLPHIVNLDQYVVNWKLNTKEQVELYKSAIQLMEKNQEKLSSERVRLYNKFLTIFEKNYDAKLVAESVNELRQIVLFTIRNLPQEINYGKFLELKAIKEFATHDPSLYQLLNISVQGNVADFEKGKAQFGPMIAKYNLDHQQLLDRIRLNSIFQLARKNKTLKLKDVASDLNLPEDEAETCVVKAIQNGDLEAKIDQIFGMIYITSLNDPSFKSDEWKSLSDKLEDFRGNYTEFLEILRKNKK